MVELNTLNSRNTESIPFSTTIKFNRGFTHYQEHSVVVPLVFSANLANAFPGAQAILRLISDGINIPDFSSFKKRAGSGNYDNRIGALNLYLFFYDGSEVWYSVSQEAGAITLLEINIFSKTPDKIVLRYSKPLDTEITPAIQDFSIGTAISGVEIIGDQVVLLTGNEFEETNTIAVTYSVGDNPIKSTDGSIANSFTNVSVDWVDNGVNLVGDWFISSLNGDDSNSGKSFEFPKATIAAINALIQDGETLVLEDDSTWREQLEIGDSVTVRRSGTGTAKPIINASNVVTAFDLSNGQTNTYEYDATAENAATALGQPIFYEGGNQLVYQVSIADVESNPGSWSRSGNTK